MISEEKLLRIKKEIDESKESIAELKGQEKALMKQLKEDWDCASVPLAKKKIKVMEDDIGVLEHEIEELSEELEAEYGEE